MWGNIGMSSRRNFVGAAGALFCGCGLLRSAHAQAPRLLRQAVAVGGRRVKTIDVHAHCIFPEAAALQGMTRDHIYAGPPGSREAPIDNVEERFAAMDRQKVDMEVLSVNPHWYGAPRDVAAQVVRKTNESMAELCARYPDRFAGFAGLTMQDPQLAVQEMEMAIRRQGLKGIAVGAEVGVKELSDRSFDPVWQKAEELGAVVFVHPQGVPQLNQRLAGNGYLSNVIGNPLGTTIALAHMIFEGVFDRAPGLKVIAAHGGGFLAHYADRFDHGCRLNPAGCDSSITLKKKPTEYLKQIWFDSLVFTPEAIRHLQAVAGPNQIVMGSDWPYPWVFDPVDHILASNSLNDAQKRGVLGETAAKLLNIPT
jgi:predicted TIM-barrel fold metal-dependent hydrolase